MGRAVIADIKACLIEHLALSLDSDLAALGFRRAAKGLVYKRTFKDAIQKIDIALEPGPKDGGGRQVTIHPYLEVEIAAIEAVLAEMFADDVTKFSTPHTTLRQPLETAATKHARARWHVSGPGDIPAVVATLGVVLSDYGLPLLAAYATAADVALLNDAEDPRLLNDRTQQLKGVAAALIRHGPKAALIRMEIEFGKKGLRATYQRGFDYLQALLGEPAAPR